MDMFQLLMQNLLVLHPFMEGYIQKILLLQVFPKLMFSMIRDNSICYDLMFVPGSISDFQELFHAFPLMVSQMLLQVSQ